MTKESPQVLGERAARLMAELAPYLDKLEKQSLDTAVTQHWQHQEGEENVFRLLERANVIRALRMEIGAVIAHGRIAAETEDRGVTTA